MKTFQKIKNNVIPWSATLRPKVGMVVTYNGIDYQNTSGKNSEPQEISSDWFIINNGASGGLSSFNKDTFVFNTGDSQILTTSKNFAFLFSVFVNGQFLSDGQFTILGINTIEINDVLEDLDVIEVQYSVSEFVGLNPYYLKSEVDALLLGTKKTVLSDNVGSTILTGTLTTTLLSSFVIPANTIGNYLDLESIKFERPLGVAGLTTNQYFLRISNTNDPNTADLYATQSTTASNVVVTFARGSHIKNGILRVLNNAGNSGDGNGNFGLVDTEYALNTALPIYVFISCKLNNVADSARFVSIKINTN